MNDWDDNKPNADSSDDSLDDLFGWADDAEDVSDQPDDPSAQEWRMSHPSLVERRMEQDIEDAEDAAFGNTKELLDWMADASDVSTVGDDEVDRIAGLSTTEMEAVIDADTALINRVSDNTQRDYLEDTARLNALVGQEASPRDTDFLNRLTTSELTDRDTGLLDQLATSDGDDPIIDTGMLDELASTGKTGQLVDEARADDSGPDWDVGAVFADLETEGYSDAPADDTGWDVGAGFAGQAATTDATNPAADDTGWDVGDAFLGIEDEPPPPSVRAPKVDTSEWEVGNIFADIDEDAGASIGPRKLRDTSQIRWDEAGAEFVELGDDGEATPPGRKKPTGRFDWGDTGTLEEDTAQTQADAPADDVPDWLADMPLPDDPVQTQADAPADDVPDWLAGMTLDDDPAQTQADAAPDDDFSFFDAMVQDDPDPVADTADIENLLADFGTLDETADESLEDLLGQLADADADGLDDLLADLDDVPVEEGTSLDDLLNADADAAFADLQGAVIDGSDEAVAEAASEDASEDEADFDWLDDAELAELDDAFGALFDEAEAAQPTGDTDDLDHAFGALFDEAEAAQPTGDTDDLDHAFGVMLDDEDVASADELLPADTPDWLAAMQPDPAASSVAEPAGAAPDDDFMADLFGDEAEFAEDPLAEAAAPAALDADWLAALENDPAAEDDPLDDAFAAMFGAGAATISDEADLIWGDEAVPEEPDWLSTLDVDDLADEDFAFDAEPLADSDAAFADLFAETTEADSDDLPAPASDLDTLLGTFDLDDLDEPAPAADDLGSLFGDDFDFGDAEEDGAPVAAPADEADDLFGGMGTAALPPQAPEAEAAPEFSDDVPAWLRAAAAGAAATSAAAALVQSRKDRPVDELDDRLQGLRERGLNLTAEEPDAAPEPQASSAVPAAVAALSPARFSIGQAALITQPTLTPEQAQNAAVLSALIGTSAGAAFATMTTDPSQANEHATDADSLAGETSAASPPPQPAATNTGGRPPRPLPSRIERLIVTLALLLVVGVPFGTSTVDFGAFWSQPVATFDPETQAAQSDAFFRAQIGVQPADRVLIAADYGPASAYEVDALLRVITAHLLLREAQPVIISTNAVGLLRADALVADLAGADTRNQRFYTARFLPGGQIGLRDLVNRPAQGLATDVQGNPTGLDIATLDDFALGYIITDSAETARMYIEQLLPNTQTPFILVTGQAIKPVANAYADGISGIVGMLAGYSDAVTYTQMLRAFSDSGGLAPRPDAPDTAPTTDSAAPATVAPPEVTEAATTEEATTAPATEATEATEAEVTEAATTEAATPEPTASLDELSEFQTGTLTANVRLRTGPGTSFPAAGFAANGEQVLVLEISDGGNWVNIQLEDGTQAWVSISFIAIDAPQASEADPNAGAAKPLPDRVVLARRGAERLQQDTTEDPAGAALPTATAVADDEAPQRIPPLPQDFSLTDPTNRWNALVIGTLGAIVVIALGSILSIVRSLTGRE